MKTDNDTSGKDEHFMAIALKWAERTAKYGDVPVGCVIVKDGVIIGKAYNQVEKNRNPLAHAEMLALNKAFKKLGVKQLTGCRVYVTLEPCAQCAGALVLARVSELIYGTDDPKAGACRTLFNICDDSRLNHRMKITNGIMQIECSKILKDFFNELRLKKSK